MTIAGAGFVEGTVMGVVAGFVIGVTVSWTVVLFADMEPLSSSRSSL